MDTKHKTAWRTVRLGDVADLQWGDTKTTKAAYKSNGYPAFSATGSDGFMDHYDFDRDGVVLSAIGANCGETWFTNGKWSCIKNTIRFWGEEGKADTQFLYYKTHNKNLWPQRGSAQPFISQADARNLELEIPEDVSEQKRIAGVLAGFDEKIENNNRIIKALEEVAQAVFKEWFVNFRFPGHEKAEFVDSPLGRIPNGWEIKTLEDVMAVTIGRTPPRHESQWFRTDGQGKKWISIRDMGTSGAYTFSTAEQLTDEAVAKFNIPTIAPNTVVVSFKLTLGRVAITTEGMASNEAIAHLPLKMGSSLFPEYVYLFMQRINLADFGSTSSIGTAVNSKTVKRVPILVPERGILEEAKQALQPMFSGIRSKIQENQKLTTTRDLLLPRLMSGEVRV